MTSLIIVIIIVVIVFLLILFIVGMYNGLVTARNKYKNAYSQIDVQLKRRYDLIPNLVEVAKTYLKHERETLEAVVAARSQAQTANAAAAANPGDPGAMKNLMGAEAALGGVLTRFFALAEAYPDLKANTNMMQLSEELTSTENRISFARQAYNDAVMRYNILREKFPDVLIANNFGFKEAALFEIAQEKEREAPKVTF